MIHLTLIRQSHHHDSHLNVAEGSGQRRLMTMIISIHFVDIVMVTASLNHYIVPLMVA